MRLLLSVLLGLASTQLSHAQLSTSQRTLPPTRINVVLVTFPDADRVPHGHTKTGGVLTSGDDSYTMDDFESKFGVTGAASFKGPITVGGDEALPKSYGSLREYFREVSAGALNFDVRIINRELSDGHPEWITLPQMWGTYESRGYRRHDLIKDGLAAANTYIQMHYSPSISDYADFPTAATKDNASTEVVVFVYSGWQVQQEEDKSSLHPHAVGGGCCYVTGERQGDGKGVDLSDTFTGIGIHVHEMGHVLDVHHPQESTDDENVYAMQTPGVDTYPGTDRNGNSIQVPVAPWTSGSVAAWCSMHSGADGPATEGSVDGDNAYYYSYASCPNPYNPSHVKKLVDHLEWSNNFHTIPDGSHQGYRINPSPTDYYEVVGDDAVDGYPKLFLEFRDADSFGRYNGWYEFEQAPGLLVWRTNGFASSQTRLVPADKRRIYNAMAQPIDGASSRLWDSGFIYPWMDRISDPFGAVEEVAQVEGAGGVEANGLRQTILSMELYKDPTNTLSESYIRLDGEESRVTQDWATDASHFTKPPRGTALDDPLRIGLRNIVVKRLTGGDKARGHAVLNVYTDYWEGDITESTTWDAANIYVGADLTVKSGVTLTINSNTVVHFLNPRTSTGFSATNSHGTDGNGTGHSELIIEGTLNVSPGVKFRSMRELKNAPPGGNEKEEHGTYVMSGGRATFEGLTIDDGTHYMYVHPSGELVFNGDLVIDDQTAGINPGAVKFHRSDHASDAVTVRVANKGDSSSGAPNAGLVDFVINKTGSLDASNDLIRPVTDTSDRGAWGSIRIGATGQLVLTGVTMRDGTRCLWNDSPSNVTVGSSTFTNCGMLTNVYSLLSVMEGSASDVATFGVRSPLSTGTTAWSISATGDASQFNLGGSSGTLTLKPGDEGPDFEMPDNMDNRYRFLVKAVTSTATISDYVTVEITDDASDGHPPIPILRKDAGFTNSSARMKIQLGGAQATSPLVSILFLKVTSQDCHGEDARQHTPAPPLVWHNRNVAHWLADPNDDDDDYDRWFNPGETETFSMSPGRTYMMQARVGTCTESDDCQGDRGTGVDASDIDESHYLWSGVTKWKFSTPPVPIVVEGESSTDYWTDWTQAVGQYSVSEGTCAASSVDWTLSNNGSGYFAIDAEGNLTLTDAPNTPLGIHRVQVVATIGRQSTSFDVSVNLRRNTPGTVTLTADDPPRVNSILTATLEDHDGMENVSWRWYSAYQDDPFQEIFDDDETEHTFTLKDSHIGNRVIAKATYDDAHKKRATAHSAPSDYIQAALTPPPTDVTGTLSASPNPPVATQTLTITLTDPDIRERDPAPTWTWTLVPDTGPEQVLTSVTSNEYRVPAANVGDQLRVSVTYTDAFNTHTLETTTEAVVAAPPTDVTGTLSYSPNPPVATKDLTFTLTDPDIRERDPAPTWTWTLVPDTGSEQVLTSVTSNEYRGGLVKRCVNEIRRPS